jgi:hypothetical protein
VLKTSTARGSCIVTLKGRTINIYKRDDNTKSFVYKNILNQINKVTDIKIVLSTDSLIKKESKRVDIRTIMRTKIFFLLKFFSIR